MYLYLAIAIVAAAVSAAGTWEVQNWRYGAKEADRLEQQAKEKLRRAEKIDTAATAHEKDKGAIRTEFLTITQTVEKVVHEPFYLPSELCFDDAGLRAITAATGAKPAASQPAGAVPRPVRPE